MRMFKYPKALKEESKSSSDQVSRTSAADMKSNETKSSATISAVVTKKDVSPEALRELLEKNLKWSQIIYEQTRKINSKLFWKSVWGWVIFFILVVAPTAFTIWYLPPLLRGLEKKYQPLLSLMGSASATSTVNNMGSIDEILKLLPISNEQKSSLKAVLSPK